MISWWFKPQAGVILISLWLCKSVHFWQTRQWCQEMTITATQVRSSMVCNISQAPEHTLLYSTNRADRSTVDTYAAMQIINWNKWAHVKSTELWSCSHSRVTANRYCQRLATRLLLSQLTCPPGVQTTGPALPNRIRSANETAHLGFPYVLGLSSDSLVTCLNMAVSLTTIFYCYF